jgi:hypothetical protein
MNPVANSSMAWRPGSLRQRTAVVVIDMQVDFASPEGCWASTASTWAASNQPWSAAESLVASARCGRRAGGVRRSVHVARNGLASLE